MGILNALGQFALPAAAPTFFNISMIIANFMATRTDLEEVTLCHLHLSGPCRFADPEQRDAFISNPLFTDGGVSSSGLFALVFGVALAARDGHCGKRIARVGRGNARRGSWRCREAHRREHAIDGDHG